MHIKLGDILYYSIILLLLLSLTQELALLFAGNVSTSSGTAYQLMAY